MPRNEHPWDEYARCLGFESEPEMWNELRYFLGLEYAQIAAVLGVSPNTVSNRVQHLSKRERLSVTHKPTTKELLRIVRAAREIPRDREVTR